MAAGAKRANVGAVAILALVDGVSVLLDSHGVLIGGRDKTLGLDGVVLVDPRLGKSAIGDLELRRVVGRKACGMGLAL